MKVVADEEEMSFCEFCFSSPELVAEVRSRGRAGTSPCKVCGSVGLSLSVEDDMLRKMIRALIRLYYSEVEYNGHLGGDALSILLFGKNRLFALDPTIADPGEFEAAILTVESGWYPPTDTEVSLGGGYWDGCTLFSPYDWVDGDVHRIFSRSLSTNYYELIRPLQALFKTIRSDVTRNVVQLEVFRARRGFEKRFLRGGDIIGANFSFAPYSGPAIGASPIAVVGEGRFNRTHVSVFYAASDVATAIAEVRPEPGQIISIGKFRQNSPLLLADFSLSTIKNYLNDADFERLHRIVSFDMVLSVPVASESKPIYLIPQLIADVVREEGFDGIVFDSTMTGGKNYAVFKPDAFEFVPDSSCAHVVYGQVVESSPVNVRFSEDNYWKEAPDSLASTLSGLVEMHRQRKKGHSSDDGSERA